MEREKNGKVYHEEYPTFHRNGKARAPLSNNSNSKLEATAKSAGSRLGVMMLVEYVKQGNSVNIPSLGITITKDDLESDQG